MTYKLPPSAAYGTGVYTEAQMQAAYEAGRASRDAELAMLKTVLEAVKQDEKVLQAEIESLKADAARYRWLRIRLKVMPMQAVSGGFRDALEVKIGCSFLDSTFPQRGSTAYQIQQAEKLDTAISAAIAAEGKPCPK